MGVVIQADFGNPHNWDEVRLQLGMLVMEGNEKVIDFMARFNILQAKAGFSYERLWELFQISVNKEIREGIHRIHKYKRPTSVEDTYHIVQSAGYQVEFEKSREVIVQGARQTLKKLAGCREAGCNGDGDVTMTAL